MSTRLAWADADIWLQAARQTELWSASRQGKITDLAPAWSYFRQVGPQKGGTRIPVQHPTTRETVYVDADAVGPSGPPPSGWAFEQPQNSTAVPLIVPSLGGSSELWVSNFVPARLWPAPTSKGFMLGEAPAGHYFKLLEPQRGPRLWVEDPITSGQAYVEAEKVGPVGPPPSSPVPTRWWGFVGVDDINVRTDPNDESTILGTLAQGLPVVVETWIEGEEVLNDQPGWAKLGEGVFIYSPLLRKARIETPPPMPSHGPLAARWIDVNLTQQTVTAYEDDVPVYLALTSSGRLGWETHEGIHEIFWRKEVETMDSASLLGQDASRASYRIENIRWTQYFTDDGQAIHENFWRDPKLFGIPSSHGCLGLSADDARWFWEWAARGTPLSVHS